MTIVYDIEGRDRRLVAFGWQDTKGRPMGSIVQTWRVAACYGPARQGAFFSYLAPGLYYVAEVQASRGEQPFGAVQPRHYFSTWIECEAFITRRVEESRVRAARK